MYKTSSGEKSKQILIHFLYANYLFDIKKLRLIFMNDVFNMLSVSL